MMLRGEYQSNGRRAFPSAALSKINPTLTGLGLNLGNSGKRPAIKHLNLGRARDEYCQWMLINTFLSCELDF
jgi:hypothetical protein